MTLVGMIRDALLGVHQERAASKIEDSPLGHCTAMADAVVKVIAPHGVMLTESQFEELLTMIDDDAKLYHRRGGSVASTLKRVLERYEEMRREDVVGQWLESRARSIHPGGGTLPDSLRLRGNAGPMVE